MPRWCMAAIRICSRIKHNEGQFQVLVPLHNATFAFQPDWPALNRPGYRTQLHQRRPVDEDG